MLFYVLKVLFPSFLFTFTSPLSNCLLSSFSSTEYQNCFPVQAAVLNFVGKILCNTYKLEGLHELNLQEFGSEQTKEYSE